MYRPRKSRASADAAARASALTAWSSCSSLSGVAATCTSTPPAEQLDARGRCCACAHGMPVAKCACARARRARARVARDGGATHGEARGDDGERGGEHLRERDCRNLVWPRDENRGLALVDGSAHADAAVRGLERGASFVCSRGGWRSGLWSRGGAACGLPRCNLARGGVPRCRGPLLLDIFQLASLAHVLAARVVRVACVVLIAVSSADLVAAPSGATSRAAGEQASKAHRHDQGSNAGHSYHRSASGKGDPTCCDVKEVTLLP